MTILIKEPRACGAPDIESRWTPPKTWLAPSTPPRVLYGEHGDPAVERHGIMSEHDGLLTDL
jgi:hypothetical protein